MAVLAATFFPQLGQFTAAPLSSPSAEEEEDHQPDRGNGREGGDHLSGGARDAAYSALLTKVRLVGNLSAAFRAMNERHRKPSWSWTLEAADPNGEADAS